MSNHEFLERLNGVFYITAEGSANCAQTQVNILKDVKNNKSRFIVGLPIGAVGDYIEVNNLQIKTCKFVKRKILNIFYISTVIFPHEENDLIEIVNGEDYKSVILNEFKTFPNDSGLIKLKEAKHTLTTKNTTACAIIGKGVDISFRPAKRDKLLHVVIDLLSVDIRCNIIGWNFITIDKESSVVLPKSNHYVFFNVKVAELNKKCYFSLDNMSIIMYKFCNEYTTDINRITGKWNELQFSDFRWYNKKQKMIECEPLENALIHVEENINSPVVITLNDVIINCDNWNTRFFTRHNLCGNVIPYSEGLKCAKCAQFLERDDNWWLLTTAHMNINGKRYNVKINDNAYVKLLNQIDLTLLNVDISTIESFYQFKKIIQDNPIDEINQLEELYLDFLEDKELVIKLKVMNNGKGGAWAISYEVMDILFESVENKKKTNH